MKKVMLFLACLGFLLMPLSALALPAPAPSVKITNTAVYDLGRNDSLRIGTFVCKVASCDIDNPTDWFNYSSTPGAMDGTGNSGEGTTLTVAPGDDLTFLGEIAADTVEGIYPVFHIDFTNAAYLENVDVLGTGQENLDGDSVHYDYDPGTEKITFNVPIGGGGGASTDPQLGSITARIKDNVPDGTVITATFVYEAEGQFLQTKNPFVQTAYADDGLARSEVRILVNNADTTLPRTGGTIIDQHNNLVLLAVASLVLGLVGVRVVSRRKQAQK